MTNMLNNVKIYINKKQHHISTYSVIFCVSEQLKPFLIALCEIQTERRLKTAVRAYDAQTTALDWIKEASVPLVA